MIRLANLGTIVELYKALRDVKSDIYRIQTDGEFNSVTFYGIERCVLQDELGVVSKCLALTREILTAEAERLQEKLLALGLDLSDDNEVKALERVTYR